MISYLTYYTMIRNLPILIIIMLVLLGWILANFSMKKALILYPRPEFKQSHVIYGSLFWGIGLMILPLIINLNIAFYMCSVVVFPFMSIRRVYHVLPRQNAGSQ